MEADYTRLSRSLKRSNSSLKEAEDSIKVSVLTSKHAAIPKHCCKHLASVTVAVMNHTSSVAG